jgi:hypothetical protein
VLFAQTGPKLFCGVASSSKTTAVLGGSCSWASRIWSMKLPVAAAADSSQQIRTPEIANPRGTSTPFSTTLFPPEVEVSTTVVDFIIIIKPLSPVPNPDVVELKDVWTSTSPGTRSR